MVIIKKTTPSNTISEYIETQGAHIEKLNRI